jgi:hypothetical protein
VIRKESCSNFSKTILELSPHCIDPLWMLSERTQCAWIEWKVRRNSGRKPHDWQHYDRRGNLLQDLAGGLNAMQNDTWSRQSRRLRTVSLATSLIIWSTGKPGYSLPKICANHLDKANSLRGLVEFTGVWSWFNFFPTTRSPRRRPKLTTDMRRHKAEVVRVR